MRATDFETAVRYYAGQLLPSARAERQRLEEMVGCAPIRRARRVVSFIFGATSPDTQEVVHYGALLSVRPEDVHSPAELHRLFGSSDTASNQLLIGTLSMTLAVRHETGLFVPGGEIFPNVIYSTNPATLSLLDGRQIARNYNPIYVAR